MSKKCGVALQYFIALAEEIKLNAGKKTSWFSLISMASNDRWSALVPLFVHNTNFDFVNSLIFFSNNFVYEP